MVAVVPGDEEAEPYHVHRLPETRMKSLEGKLRFLRPLKPHYQFSAGGAEAVQQVRQAAFVVAGLVSLSILEAGSLKPISAQEQAFKPASPERFEVEQVAHVLLNGPVLIPT